MQITLDRLKKGQVCKVLSINIKDRARQRHLLDMGLTKGTIIKVKRIAPMGDPISIELRGYILCVSKLDMQKITGILY